jgi:Rod binding domain-containing protein
MKLMFISINPTLPDEAAGSKPGNITQNELSAADLAKSAKTGKAIKDFEGLFMSMIIKELRQTSSGDGLFAGDASDTYGGMFDMFLGNELTEGKGLGLESLFRSSTAIRQLEQQTGHSGTLNLHDRAIEGYRNEQFRAGAIALPGA